MSPEMVIFQFTILELKLPSFGWIFNLASRENSHPFHFLSFLAKNTQWEKYSSILDWLIRDFRKVQGELLRKHFLTQCK